MSRSAVRFARVMDGNQCLPGKEHVDLPDWDLETKTQDVHRGAHIDIPDAIILHTSPHANA